MCRNNGNDGHQYQRVSIIVAVVCVIRIGFGILRILIFISHVYQRNGQQCHRQPAHALHVIWPTMAGNFGVIARNGVWQRSNVMYVSPCQP